MHIQYTRKSQKWSPKTSQSHQNEVPRGTQSRQNNENSEKKVTSNENINIYNTFEGLGHQNSQEFPFKNQQKTWLQSKCDFGLLKSEKIWKSDPEWSPMGDPKSIKNRHKSTLGPTSDPLSASLPHLVTKMLAKKPPQVPMWCQNGVRGAGGRGRSPWIYIYILYI